MRLSCCILLSLFLPGCHPTVTAQNQTSAESRITREWKDADGTTLPCQIFLPVNYNKAEKYPLVLCLHGSGGMRLAPYTVRTAPSSALLNPAMREKYPAILLVPQTDTGWVARPDENVLAAKKLLLRQQAGESLTPEEQSQITNLTANIRAGTALQLALQALGEVMKEYPVDDRRVYVSGESMGGIATWYLILHYPDIFAAAVPICGIGDPQQAAAIRCPVWAFHGAKDKAVPVTCSRDMVEAMKKAGREVKYTEYPDVEHNSWMTAWKDPGLVPWLFAQTKTDAK